jgi:hypothetical protein
LLISAATAARHGQSIVFAALPREWLGLFDVARQQTQIAMKLLDALGAAAIRVIEPT